MSLSTRPRLAEPTASMPSRLRLDSSWLTGTRKPYATLSVSSAPRKRCAWENSLARWEHLPIWSRSLKRRFVSAWGCKLLRFLPKSFSATVTRITWPRWRRLLPRSIRLQRRYATCNAQKCARPKNISVRNKKVLRPCRTSGTRSPASRSAAWRAWCERMRRQHLRTWRYGMSAISRIRRWSA